MRQKDSGCYRSRSPLYVLSNKERNTLKHIKQSDISEGQMDSKLKINYSTALLMPLLNHYRGGQDKDFKILKAFHVQVCSDICWSPSPL